MAPLEQPNAEDAEVARNAQKDWNQLSEKIIGCAVEVQRNLGTGLLESAYAGALGIELRARGLPYAREVPIAATYKGEQVGIGYRADFLVQGCVLLELKAVDSVSDIHRAQLLSYLRMGGFKLGLLINFRAFPVAPRGVTRVVNQF